MEEYNNNDIKNEEVNQLDEKKSSMLDINVKSQFQNHKQNFKNKNFSSSEMILLVIIALFIGFCVGKIVLNNSSETNNIKVGNYYTDEYIGEFIDNYNYIVNNYYEEIDKDSLIKGAISGMMDSLDDPYSVYLDESDSSNFSITLDGSYKGIGIQILKDEDTGYMLITSIFKNSPASQAGLKAGDYIVSLNNKQVKEMTASDVSSMIRQSDSDEIEMKILRDSSEIEIKLNKSVVTLDSVISKTFEQKSKKIGYIYIGIFASNTYEQFKNELDKLESENIDALIIDVRDNSGGHLTAVDSILDIFLNSNQIMYQFSQNEIITTIRGTGNENKKYEIVLIGNENSASASEVLIAGLKENLGSKLFGEKTYGKGTVQELINLPNGSQYKITVKKWLTPNGNWINDTKGIEPDVEVKLSDEYLKTGLDEDDSQLQKVLEYIINK